MLLLEGWYTLRGHRNGKFKTLILPDPGLEIRHRGLTNNPRL